MRVVIAVLVAVSAGLAAGATLAFAPLQTLVLATASAAIAGILAVRAGRRAGRR